MKNGTSVGLVFSPTGLTFVFIVINFSDSLYFSLNLDFAGSGIILLAFNMELRLT